MNPVELPLRDIHLPAEPGFWPLAPGWWVLILFALVMLVLGWWRFRRIRARQARRAAVLRVLNAAETRYRQSQDAHRLAQDLSDLLRRHVRHVLGDPQATSLGGPAWADYLTGLMPDAKRTSDTRSLWLTLADAAFNPHAKSEQADRWIAAVRDLIDQAEFSRPGERRHV